MDIDDINRARDRVLRRNILRVLRAAMGQSVSGEVSGRSLAIMADDLGEAFEDETHAMALVSDMEGRGYLARRDTRTRRMERFGLGSVMVRILPAGVDLLDGNRPVDPAVEDERRVDNTGDKMTR